jgi:hypothetical protein
MRAGFLLPTRKFATLSTTQTRECGTREAGSPFSIQCVCCMRGAVMRSIRFFVTASIFSSIFIGLALASAVITGAVQAQLSSRSVPMILTQN